MRYALQYNQTMANRIAVADHKKAFRNHRIMFGRGIGPLEIFLIVLVVLIIFGAGRLPEVGRGIGTAIKEFRGSIGGKERNDSSDKETTDTTGKGENQDKV